MWSAVDARLGAVDAHGGGRVALKRRPVDRSLAMVAVPIGPSVEANHRRLNAVKAPHEEGEVVWCVGHGLRLASFSVG